MNSTVVARRVFGLTLCGHLILGNASGAPKQEPGLLHVKDQSLVPGQAGATVLALLRNDSTKVAVAWTIKTILTFADGTSTARYLETDVAPEGMSDPLNGPILPGHERSVRSVINIQSPAGPPHAITITVVATVFSDNTAIGEPKFLRLLAENRRQAESDWEKGLAILESASRHGASSIDALRSALDEIERSGASSVVLQALRLRVRMALGRLQKGETTGDAELGQILEHCRRQRIEANARLLPLPDSEQ